MKLKTAEILERWTTYLRHNRGRSKGTVGKYRRYLEELDQWLDPSGGQLLDVSRQQLEAFTGQVLHSRGVAPRWRPYIAAIRTFYQWARSNDLVMEDPSRHLVYPNTGRKLPKGMTLANAERLLLQPDLGTFKGVRDSAILHLFMGAGLRLAGLAALNEQDLLFTDWQDREHLVLRVIEKGDKERYIPVPHEARLMIRAYLGHPELAAINRELPDGNRVLFVSIGNHNVPQHEYCGENRRLGHWSIQDMLKTYADKAGIPRDQAHPHALRHLYGTELAEDDVHILKMQALMGHARAEDTKAYAHVALRSLAKAVATANPLAKINSPASDLARRLK